MSGKWPNGSDYHERVSLTQVLAKTSNLIKVIKAAAFSFFKTKVPKNFNPKKFPKLALKEKFKNVLFFVIKKKK